MQDRDALVSNAGDRQQLERASRVEKERALQWAKDFRELMELPAFRRFLWELLARCKVFNSIWSPNAQIHYNAGQQDIGHWAQGEAVTHSPEQYFTMIKENSNA